MAEETDTLGVVDDADLGELARRLLSFQTPNGDFSVHPELSAQDCLTVCYMAVKQLDSSRTPTCLQAASPINIVGDLNGQFHDLLRFFDKLGHPPHTKYLFLGNYVNHGKFSLEVIVLLLSLMVMHPDSVQLLRGNESASTCSHSGFKDEVLGRFGQNVGNQVLVGFLCCFQWLPLASIIGGKLLCCHGGISPSLLLEPFQPGQVEANVELLNKIERPFELQHFGLVCDLLSSDPMLSVTRDSFGVSVPEEERLHLNWVSNCARGCSYQFSPDALASALQTFNVRMLFRGNQFSKLGFILHHNGLCSTLFSSPGYRGTHSNHGALFQVDLNETDLTKVGSFFVLHPTPELLLEENRSFLYWPTVDD